MHRCLYASCRSAEALLSTAHRPANRGEQVNRGKARLEEDFGLSPPHAVREAGPERSGNQCDQWLATEGALWKPSSEHQPVRLDQGPSVRDSCAR